ncbi:DUF305 domain-containing protein [Geodermatophilus sp. DSM 45219]|uniref:DUF305 domain-containing protein n=1 Tax=Geodermatophilus sp. DSM 45219 TaxID=1881103 RepID=UPI000884C3BA|nr:DUF305 domain-containing protein [Geodermatophilus sp. DSM 45219]SDO37494.1 Uncharacterized conserved protein, DUF305 family [Geodermatophilus sp. DSM 45219]
MTRTNVRLARLTGGIIAGTIVLAGCSDGSDDMAGMEGMDSSTSAESSAGAESSDESAQFNNADVTFVQGMIPHHRGALEMARMADGRAEDPRVLDLANRIEAAQQPEIETMTGWLQEWGEPLPEEGSDSMGSMDHGSMDMGGMDMEGMSEEDMAALEAASGAEFDRMWLEMMIVHHRGAVEMAQTEIAEGSNADAVALAEEIADSQAAEIEEMETLLAELGG